LQRPHIAHKYKLSARYIEDHLNALHNFAEIASGRLSLDVISADPQDNHVLAAAVETRCAVIISGDHHLLDLGEYQNVSSRRATS
jgi:predicted nucleic acid-binding protein